MGSCKLCNDETNSRFNINLNAVYVCEPCAERIFLQQAKWYVEKERGNREDSKNKVDADTQTSM